MTDRTTITLEITAFDTHATATYRVHATSKDNPAASIAALVSLLDRFGWVEEKLDVPAFAPTATIEGLPDARELLARGQPSSSRALSRPTPTPTSNPPSG